MFNMKAETFRLLNGLVETPLKEVAVTTAIAAAATAASVSAVQIVVLVRIDESRLIRVERVRISSIVPEGSVSKSNLSRP